MNKEKIILIDAYSQIFRCFYGLRELTNAKGEPINAIFTFARLLLSLHNEFPSSYGAMVFDCGKVDFRMELNPDYKAQRPPTPDDLLAQIPALRNFSEAFGWPLLEEPQYEADDLIAALALKSDKDVSVISSDKDLAQIISNDIIMMVPEHRKPGWQFRGVEDTNVRYGVAPEQIIDFLSLVGDSADNIPGVPGIGVKTAATLLQEHGSVDKMLELPDKIGNERFRKLIIEHKQTLIKNQKLIELRSDLPSRLYPIESSCIRREPDWVKVDELCIEHGLNSIRRELPTYTGNDTEKGKETEKPKENFIQGDLFGEF